MAQTRCGSRDLALGRCSLPKKPDHSKHFYVHDPEAERTADEEARSTVALTRLTEKAASPLTIRKVTKFGFPIFVGIITDDNLDTLDSVIVRTVKEHLPLWKSDSLQDKRELSFKISEAVTEAFQATEGVAVTLFIDKCCISSLFGDFMNHGMCRDEYYLLLNMSTGI